MPEDRVNIQPKDENGELNEKREEETTERFESDTQKIVRRHLENEDDVISDEDIANIRVGMVPPEFDRATEVRFQGDEAREELEDDLTEGTADSDKDENLDKGQITPWDTIDPGK